jgi:protein SCO1/2
MRGSLRHLPILGALTLALALVAYAGVFAGNDTADASKHDEHAGHMDPEDRSAQMVHADHSAHMATLEAKDGEPSYTRSLSTYAPPQVNLVDRDGEEQSLAALLETDSPVMLNFIFTSCTTICPIQTATFVEAQKQLAADHEHVQLVSISIDPEVDTPVRLTEYARARGAGEPWAFLTGDLASIRKAQEAFGAYRGNKMNHVPLTFLRASAGDPWVRIDGFPSASDLVREYRTLTVE